MFRIKCSGNQNTHFQFNTSFPKSYRLPNKVDIMYSRASQATDSKIHRRKNSRNQIHNYSLQTTGIYSCCFYAISLGIVL